LISIPLRLGFLASGNGSSAKAIVEAAARGELAAEPRLLVGNKRDTPAFAWAEQRGVPHLCIPTVADPAAADARLAEALQAHGVEVVILSGYLRRLGPATLAAYAGRILNIHPGPLPEYGGEGMYGARVHQAVIAAGASASAIVVHAVDEEYDHGPELARQAVPIQPGDTAEQLEARVKALEPDFFVETLKRIVTTKSLVLPAA
jgi:phosphoribosylglycinamide formyltransferase-1